MPSVSPRPDPRELILLCVTGTAVTLMERDVMAVVHHDTACISALHVLKVHELRLNIPESSGTSSAWGAQASWLFLVSRCAAGASDAACDRAFCAVSRCTRSG